MGRVEQQALEAGQLVLRASWTGARVQTRHDALEDVEGQGAIPVVHDQRITISEARLSLDVGLSSRFGASVMLPVRVVSTGIDYVDGMGRSVTLVSPSTHHRDETLAGLADPMVLGAASHAWGRLRLTARAGLSLPLGRTEADPFVRPDVEHQHIQFGTGTFNPVAAVEAVYARGPWRLAGFALTQQVLYENAKGFHAGDRYAAGLSLRRALGAWQVRGGAELQAETFERWSGIRYTEEGNQGRIDALVVLGASRQLGRGLSLDATLKLALVNHVVGGQLSMPAIVDLGATYTFGATASRRAEHDHGHDHGDEHGHDHDDDHGHDPDDAHGHEPPGEHVSAHDHEHAAETNSAREPGGPPRGADILDLGQAGARVELAPVPGKVTIFDFWAPWCEPCKKLEPVLVELARRFPEKVALRRIDVVDWDTPVVAQHLTPGRFDLPHVKILDAAGTLRLEVSSGPGRLQAMIDAVRALVESLAAQAR